MPSRGRRAAAKLIRAAGRRAAARTLDIRRVQSAIVRVGSKLPFEEWEQRGWHLTPNHFYSPIPDTRELGPALRANSDLPGIDMRDEAQQSLLKELSAEVGEEWAALPRTAAGDSAFYIDNHAFESVDAELLYGLIRHFKPKRYCEIGSGWSTMCALTAARRNVAEGHACQLEAIEPYPYGFLQRMAADPLLLLSVQKVQDVPMDRFTSLGAGDILFIDSSHVVRAGSDVQREFLEILPRLAPGVLVHVHDVFLPAEYPQPWFLEEHRFWNEQYLLQAFLIGNRTFEVLWAGNYMHQRHPDAVEQAIPSYDRTTRQPGSFWIRRTDS
jgi:predicted O-methyltransferase YrrM